MSTNSGDKSGAKFDSKIDADKANQASKVRLDEKVKPAVTNAPKADQKADHKPGEKAKH